MGTAIRSAEALRKGALMHSGWMTRFRLSRKLLLALLVASNILWPVGSSATVEILPGTTLEADQETVKAILATFERAEDALKARDIDGIMALYSESYNYHGLRKSDMRRIWESLFANHRDLSTTHLFSRIVVTGPKGSPIAEVTCNGVLLARSDITVGKIAIDSWYGETHYLAREDGAWRIRGNSGERPKALQFGTAPHPLF